MKVVLTESALADLTHIGRQIRQDNPKRAESFIEELHDRCRRLETAPLAFPLIPGWEDRGIRRRSYGNYLIFYRVTAEQVEILHVLHGARDYEALLFPED